MSKGGYGIPLVCPKCPREYAHRALKTPRIKTPDCPDCGTSMVPTDLARREAWERRQYKQP